MSNISRSDSQIIGALQSNARQTNRAIANEVGLAPSTTLDRIRSLEDRGVITGYHADVDLAALGRPIQAIVTLRLRPKTGPVIDRAIERLMSLPETLGVFLVTGIDDLIVHLSVTDTDNLRHLVLDRISSIEGVVGDRTSLVFEHKRKQVIETLVDY
ncbi:MAG: Lrp/AsnC family transcriptional regulator [Acidimicrobiales bacterium]|nr:Lrp/AsnC family transcriptional regulator [Acidimicrobiales bacterium]